MFHQHVDMCFVSRAMCVFFGSTLREASGVDQSHGVEKSQEKTGKASDVSAAPRSAAAATGPDKDLCGFFLSLLVEPTLPVRY